MATHINEYGEIIRDNDPNDKSEKSISFFEGLTVVIYNHILFIPGLILYYNHKKKGYTKKAKQVGTITVIELVIAILLILMAVANS